jgi:hypothetical protein
VGEALFIMPKEDHLLRKKATPSSPERAMKDVGQGKICPSAKAIRL